MHGLLHLTTLADVQGHPKLGASWEGFAIEQIITPLQAQEAYFWATHSGAELDLLVHIHGKRYGFEITFADALGVTPSMRIVLNDLALNHLWMINLGRQAYPLDTRITVLPLTNVS